MNSEGSSRRLCILVRKTRNEEYGCIVITVHNEHQISSIDPEGTAWKSGLRNGNVIVAVNGVNVLNESSEKVHQLINADSFKCSLLVTDSNSLGREEALSKSPYMLASNNNGLEVIGNLVDKLFSTSASRSYSRVTENENLLLDVDTI
ncbi:unnamed protein product, partial [Mesorhabditis belari]|uniref:PDZ domain-containing protein n=1 Tax=Mesorhabditis belari TaxID=2138241 RepID=A0AAF3F1U9_9BILA